VRPRADEVLDSVIWTFDTYIAPEVHEPYASSRTLTLAQLLRHVRARIRGEGDALWEDNRELRQLLAELQGGLAPALSADVAQTLSASLRPPDVYPSLLRLTEEATALRGALDRILRALPDDAPERQRIRSYLGAQLTRQQPWLVDAFDGPRR